MALDPAELVSMYWGAYLLSLSDNGHALEDKADTAGGLMYFRKIRCLWSIMYYNV